MWATAAGVFLAGSLACVGPAQATRAPAATCGGSYCNYVGKLPKSFPRAVPLPAGSRILASQTNGPHYFGVDLAVRGTAKGIIAAYMKKLSRAGLSPQGPNKPMGDRSGKALLGVSGSSAKFNVIGWVYRGAPDQYGIREHLRQGELGFGLSVSPPLF